MISKLKKILIVALILPLAFTFISYPQALFFPSKVFAQSDDELEKQLKAKQEEIKQLQSQLDQARSQERSLKSELARIDAQIKLTELKIEEAQFEITKLDKQVNDLNARIDRLSGTVDQMTQLLLNRIVSTYKYSNYDVIDLLFSARGFADLLERIKYIQVIQANDKKVLYQLQATKSTYNDQKQDKQTRQAQQQAIKKQLEELQKQLDQQKKAKDALLRITQNNEAIYQAKLQAALEEQQAILAILSGQGNEISDGPTHKGDKIGNFISGKSACSTGSHLHFEVHVNGELKNPANYLSNTSINKWDNSPDGTFSFSGGWDWPIQPPIDIEQGFGNTWWAQRGWYTNPPGHTGIDIYSESSTDVKTIHDGALYHGGVSCGGGKLLYKKVDHQDSTTVYYLHVI